MVESDKVIINDFHIINELTTFIERRNSFAAEDGCHDDMVMCMVIYAWAVAQDYFKEMTDQSIRKELYERDKDSLEEDMSPFGFIDDGLMGRDQFVDGGEVWSTVDEYGTPAGGWELGGNPSWW